MEQFTPLLQKSPDLDQVRVVIDAICHRCPDVGGKERRHRIDVTAECWGSEAMSWELKHRGHHYEFISPKRTIPQRFNDWVYRKTGYWPWFLQFQENANLLLEYPAMDTVTITLASLASSATWVVGRQSTAILNSTNKYDDYQFFAEITTGTTPVVDTEIRIYGVQPVFDDPTVIWPDAFTATDAGRTITNANILAQLPLLQSTKVTATTGVAYPFVRQKTWCEAFGWPSKNMVVYVSHNGTAALNATGGNHTVFGRGIYWTS